MSVNNLKVVLASIAIGLFYGCTALTEKSATTLEVTDILRLGHKAIARWEQNSDIDALLEAEHYYQHAINILPDNIRLQKAYYSNLYLLAIVDWTSWHEKLEQQFNATNSLLKSDLSPPSLLKYNYLYVRKASIQQQITVLKEAVREQPESSRAWYALSNKLEESKQFELSLYSALRAVDIEDNSAEFSFQVGGIYDELARNQQCIYDTPELSRKSVQYTAKAVAIKSNELRYQSYLATLYSRLGLYPLALQVAKKAFEIEDSRWTTEILAQAYFDMHQYDNADQQYQRLYNVYDQRWANELRAALAVTNNQWNEAQRLLALGRKANQADIYSRLLTSWIEAINRPQENYLMISLKEPNRKWESILYNYINQQDDPQSLIEQSNNLCEAAQAYFYTAMKRWIEGDMVEAKENLQAVLDQKTYALTEYIWARAFLKSNLFE